MTNTKLRASRGTSTAIATLGLAALLAGCASAQHPITTLSGQQANTQPSPVNATPAGNPGPGATGTPGGPRPSPSHSHTGNPGSGPGGGGGHPGPPAATAVVSAVNSSYIGLCPPPTTATTFRAVISVPAGPATVTFRWTTSNGGDSDPSTQTVHFSGAGRQSTTVYHNEHFYPGSPYPAQISDWVAVDLMSPVQARSNHVPITIKCVPFTVAIKRTSNDYLGPCPPPAGATGFDLYVNSSVDTDATVHWQLYDGGDSGPNPTVAVHLVPGMNVFHHAENEYPPAPYPAVVKDFVVATVTAGSYSANTDKVVFATECTS